MQTIGTKSTSNIQYWTTNTCPNKLWVWQPWLQLLPVATTCRPPPPPLLNLFIIVVEDEIKSEIFYSEELDKRKYALSNTLTCPADLLKECHIASVCPLVSIGMSAESKTIFDRYFLRPLLYENDNVYLT
ncbi:hypothetical protein LXL04_021197 [Taraxacum kok-saghyz]